MLATIAVLALMSSGVTLDQPEPVNQLEQSECTSGEAESVFLPGGGEVETLKVGREMHVNFYLDGERVLTVAEIDGRVDTEVTEYGLALAPQRATAFRNEVVNHADVIIAGTEECGALSSQADENAKCDLIGIGAGILGGLAGGAFGGPLGAAVGAGAGYSLGTLCSWLVAKVCEGNSEGC